MNYELAEQEIVDKLNAEIAATNTGALYEAALLPDTEEGYRQFYNNFNKTRVAVQVIDITPQFSKGADATNQEEIVRFRLTFESKKLRGPGGLYSMFTLTKKVLIGCRLANAINRMTFVKYGLLEFEQGAIQPYFEFECKVNNNQLTNDNIDDVPFGEYPIVPTYQE